MSYLTPDEAKAARDSLKLSQSLVARETGIDRAYLSQFENSKRILEDSQIAKLYEYYLTQGWEQPEEQLATTTEEAINSDNHGLTIMDGFVVSQAVTISQAEALLTEYYDNTEEINTIKQRSLERGFFGGLSEEELRNKSLRALALIARQCQIKELLHGHHEPIEHKVSFDDPDTLQTVGDYIEAMIQAGSSNRANQTDEEELTGAV